MNCVMKKMTCKHCRARFLPPNRGRRPRYCSAACRQKAYRKRATNPLRTAFRAMTSDLFAIQDLTARKRAAVKVLEDGGYVVLLTRRSGPPPKKHEPQLRVVKSSKGEDD